MLTVIANNEGSETISLPPKELEKFGFKEGDELEISKNEKDEIILRPVQNSRHEQILGATMEIINRRRSALIELAKGQE